MQPHDSNIYNGNVSKNEERFDISKTSKRKRNFAKGEKKRKRKDRKELMNNNNFDYKYDSSENSADEKSPISQFINLSEFSISTSTSIVSEINHSGADDSQHQQSTIEILNSLKNYNLNSK